VVGGVSVDADLQIASPRNSVSVGFVAKWVLANDMHCTCARRTGLQLHGLFLGGTHSARASQVYMRCEALMCGPFTSAEKTADPSPRSTQSTRHWRSEYCDGPCRFLKINNILVFLT